MLVGRTNRRAFIAGLGSAAAWPMVAHAQQQTVKVWRVGYLTASSATNVSVALLDDFRLKLKDLGYVEGRNLGLYIRRANDDYARLPGLASELVSLAPDVIVSAEEALVGFVPANHSCQLLAPSWSGSERSAEPSVGSPYCWSQAYEIVDPAP